MGLYGRAYRWLFYYRRHPSAFLPTHATLTVEGVLESDGHTETRTEWGLWKAVLHLSDRLVLMTALGGNCGLYTLRKRALADGDDLPQLVRLVEAQVPDHPLDPHPRLAAT